MDKIKEEDVVSVDTDALINPQVKSIDGRPVIGISLKNGDTVQSFAHFKYDIDIDEEVLLCYVPETNQTLTFKNVKRGLSDH